MDFQKYPTDFDIVTESDDESNARDMEKEMKITDILNLQVWICKFSLQFVFFFFDMDVFVSFFSMQQIHRVIEEQLWSMSDSGVVHRQSGAHAAAQVSWKEDDDFLTACLISSILFFFFFFWQSLHVTHPPDFYSLPFSFFWYVMQAKKGNIKRKKLKFPKNKTGNLSFYGNGKFVL